MTLYQIDERIENFVLDIDEETGEVLNYEELDALHMERTEKIENIGMYIKNMRAEADAIKREEKSLKDRRESIAKHADRLEAYLQKQLAGKPFSTPRVAVTWRKSSRVEILDESILPKKYLVKTVTYRPDKGLIGDMLKNGKKVRGAVRTDYMNMTIK